MGRKKKETIENSAVDLKVTNINTDFKSVAGTCNKCGTKTPLVFQESPAKAGGTKCHKCGTYDNFDCYFTKDIDDQKQICTSFTLFDVDKIKCTYVANTKCSDEFKEILENAKLPYWSIENILVQLRINFYKRDLMYTKINSEEENDIIIKQEKSLIKKLKNMIETGKENV